MHARHRLGQRVGTVFQVRREFLTPAPNATDKLGLGRTVILPARSLLSPLTTFVNPDELGDRRSLCRFYHDLERRYPSRVST